MAIVTSDKLMEFLRKKGLGKLGGGAFSDVFAAPTSDRAIKVSRRDDCWPKYILWTTAEGYAGTFAPKVYSLRYYSDQGFYVATMERLSSIRSNDPDAQTPEAKAARQLRSRIIEAAWNATGEPAKDIAPMVDFVKKIRNLGEQTDFHDGNWMLRRDGSLVITDPISYGDSRGTPRRLRTYDLAMLRNAQFTNQKAYAKRA